MKEKVLLGGTQDAILDDFFAHTDEVFTCLTTSDRSGDIKEHVRLFDPDVFVYCLGKEASHDNEVLDFALKCIRQFGNADNITVIIGDKYQFDGLRADLVEHTDLQLIKPISIKKIQLEIAEVRKKKQIEKELMEKEKLRLLQEEEANRKRHILVVDDDPTMLRTIKMYLEEKYICAMAPSGKFALKFLSQRETDLILLDYEMPEMSGQEVFQQIKNDEKMSEIPVVFLTGISDTSKIRDILAMKPQGYLLKPVDYNRLHQTIEGVLNAK